MNRRFIHSDRLKPCDSLIIFYRWSYEGMSERACKNTQCTHILEYTLSDSIKKKFPFTAQWSLKTIRLSGQSKRQSQLCGCNFSLLYLTSTFSISFLCSLGFTFFPLILSGWIIVQNWWHFFFQSLTLTFQQQIGKPSSTRLTISFRDLILASLYIAAFIKRHKSLSTQTHASVYLFFSTSQAQQTMGVYVQTCAQTPPLCRSAATVWSSRLNQM